MTIVVLIIIVQLVIAGIVIVVLKRLLDRELEKAALEKLLSLKPSENIKKVRIYHPGRLPLSVKEELMAVSKKKFLHSSIDFEQNPVLKGGLVIMVEEEVLDFSLLSRLENFWS